MVVSSSAVTEVTVGVTTTETGLTVVTVAVVMNTEVNVVPSSVITFVTGVVVTNVVVSSFLVVNSVEVDFSVTFGS